MRPAVTRDLRRVQVRTTAVATLILVLIVGLAGWVLSNRFERELRRQVDTRLFVATDYVARVGASGERFPPVGTAFDLVQVVDDHGRATYSSPALAGDPALWTPGDVEGRPHTLQTTGHGALRVMAVQFRDRWVVFASSLRPVEHDIRTLDRAMLLGLPPLALVLAALVWVVVGRTLRPVAAGVEREERLVADVSHELRSPLAGLRALLETEPREPNQIELSRRDALATLGRLEAMTDQLLVLTRQGRSPEPVPGHPVDLDEIVLHQAQAWTGRGGEQPRLDTSGVRPGQVVGHEDDLTSLVDNLLANAVHHGRSLVRVTLAEGDRTVELTVEDDGPGIGVDDRARVFDRFTRLDEARSRDRGGSGLGLAIVRAVAQSHGGSVTLDESPLGGARFAVRLPASTTPDPPTTRSVGWIWRWSARSS